MLQWGLTLTSTIEDKLKISAILGSISLSNNELTTLQGWEIKFRFINCTHRPLRHLRENSKTRK